MRSMSIKTGKQMLYREVSHCHATGYRTVSFKKENKYHLGGLSLRAKEVLLE